MIEELQKSAKVICRMLKVEKRFLSHAIFFSAGTSSVYHLRMMMIVQMTPNAPCQAVFDSLLLMVGLQSTLGSAI